MLGKRTEKEKTLILMQASLILTLIITLSTIITRNTAYLALQAAPLILLAYSLARFKKHRQEFLQHAALFLFLFIAISLIPAIINSPGPIGTRIQTTMYSVLAILLVYILIRIAVLPKTIRAKVVMADKKTVVIETDYYMLANIKRGRYVVQNTGARKGQNVTVSITRPFMRPAKPTKIIKAGKK